MFLRHATQSNYLFKICKRLYHFDGDILKLKDRGFFQDVFPAEYV